MYVMSKEDISVKCRRLGNLLFKQDMTYSKALSNVFVFGYKVSFIFSITFWYSYRHNTFWDHIILGLFLFVPPTFFGASDALKEITRMVEIEGYND